jgi:hypothetical protein
MVPRLAIQRVNHGVALFAGEGFAEFLKLWPQDLLNLSFRFLPSFGYLEEREEGQVDQETEDKNRDPVTAHDGIGGRQHNMHHGFDGSNEDLIEKSHVLLSRRWIVKNQSSENRRSVNSCAMWRHCFMLADLGVSRDPFA